MVHSLCAFVMHEHHPHEVCLWFYNEDNWPGLMKIYDFLHYKVGSNVTILVLPSKRRGGNEIITRWNKSTNRSIFPIYFQGYILPKTPLPKEGHYYG